MPLSGFRFSPAITLTLTIASSALGQTVRLPTPNATLGEDFSAIRGVRELADGRLLVSDYIDQRVVLVDMTRGTIVLRVGRGGGPLEARLPTRLVAMPGDSTILIDVGNGRLQVLDGQGNAVRTISAERHGVMGVRGVDARGGLYYAVPGWAEERGARPNDSVRVVRWDPRSRAVETVAVVQGERMRSDIRSPAPNPRIPTVGYAPQDGWVVSEAGVVRVVRAGGYRIETRTPGGPPSVGPTHSYPTRPVSPADRLAYVRGFMAANPTSGKGEGGGMGYSPALSDSEVSAMARGTQYAEHHPMFNAGDVIAEPGGRLWVGRPPEAGKPAIYEVFDEGGRRVMTVELRPGRRIMAIGHHGIYATAESDLGIQRLERYPRPARGS